VLVAENKTWEPDFALARENEKRPDLTGGLTAATRTGGTWREQENPKRALCSADEKN
jgi:hypothetical protein